MNSIQSELDLDRKLNAKDWCVVIQIARDFVSEKNSGESELEYRAIRVALACFEKAIWQTNTSIWVFENLRVKRWFKIIAITTYIRFLRFAFLDFSNDLSRGMAGKEAVDKNNTKFFEIRKVLEKITQSV
ncbi:hypothetical protein ABE527_10590 [Brucella sp. TWI432]